MAGYSSNVKYSLHPENSFLIVFKEVALLSSLKQNPIFCRFLKWHWKRYGGDSFLNTDTSYFRKKYLASSVLGT